MSILNLQKAYILHVHPYRETSLLIDLLTEFDGLIRATARGALRKKSSFHGLLQPFIPLLISGYGRGVYFTLQTAESIDYQRSVLKGRTLIDGLYLNELLSRLLVYGDPCSSIFELYNETIMQLEELKTNEWISEEQPLLRQFEKNLLEALGYGIPFNQDKTNHQPLQADQNYLFLPETGFVLAPPIASSIQERILFSGKNLLAISIDDYKDPAILRDAKRLMQLALAPHLGNKPIKTRELLNISKRK